MELDREFGVQEFGAKYNFYPEFFSVESVGESPYGRTPLHYMVYHGDLRFDKGERKLVVENGNINVSKHESFTPRNSIGASEEQPLVNVCDKNGAPPIFYATKPEVLVHLVGLSACLKVNDRNGRNLWHYLAISDSASCFELPELDSIAEKINEQDRWGLTPMHYAFAYNNGNIRAIQARGGDTERPDFKGRAPIFYSAMKYTASLELALEYGAKLDVVDQDKKYPIHHALESIEGCSASKNDKESLELRFWGELCDAYKKRKICEIASLIETQNSMQRLNLRH